jgi:hypothetical protein
MALLLEKGCLTTTNIRASLPCFHQVNGFTSLNLTKLDVLDSLDEIQVGVRYMHDGKELDSMPSNLQVRPSAYRHESRRTGPFRSFDSLLSLSLSDDGHTTVNHHQPTHNHRCCRSCRWSTRRCPGGSSPSRSAATLRTCPPPHR